MIVEHLTEWLADHARLGAEIEWQIDGVPCRVDTVEVVGLFRASGEPHTWVRVSLVTPAAAET